ncbi:MAG: hypothetical protein KDI75_05670 [Xanthomonadales bacterium]|nr:hypothetical protein [Xanthomonadales bacterium]
MNARAACAARCGGGSGWRHLPGLGLALGGLLPIGLTSAQTAVERHVVAGGGSCSGGVYQIRGSIGQSDAEPLQPSRGYPDGFMRDGNETRPDAPSGPLEAAPATWIAPTTRPAMRGPRRYCVRRSDG